MDSFSVEEMQQLMMASQLLDFNDNNLFFSDDNYNSSLPYLLNDSCDYQLNYPFAAAPELFPQQEFDHFTYQKRQKTYEDSYYIDPMNTLFDGIVANPSLLHDFTEPEIMVSSSSSNVVCVGNCAKNIRTTEKTLSAQSMAARQRGRKITEKTQELGKLIPGGQKMNTAEMFQAAFKYIKFMQAQVSILESMGSLEELKQLV